MCFQMQIYDATLMVIFDFELTHIDLRGFHTISEAQEACCGGSLHHGGINNPLRPYFLGGIKGVPSASSISHEND